MGNRKAGSKKASLAQKKKGIGLFAPVNLSPKLAAICGGKKMPRTEVTKKLWAYIKAKKLNEGRIIKPDGALKEIFPLARLTCSRCRATWASTCPSETLGEPRPFSRRVPTRCRAL